MISGLGHDERRTTNGRWRVRTDKCGPAPAKATGPRVRIDEDGGRAGTEVMGSRQRPVRREGLDVAASDSAGPFLRAAHVDVRCHRPAPPWYSGGVSCGIAPHSSWSSCGPSNIARASSAIGRSLTGGRPVWRWLRVCPVGVGTGTTWCALPHLSCLMWRGGSPSFISACLVWCPLERWHRQPLATTLRPPPRPGKSCEITMCTCRSLLTNHADERRRGSARACLPRPSADSADQDRGIGTKVASGCPSPTSERFSRGSARWGQRPLPIAIAVPSTAQRS